MMKRGTCQKLLLATLLNGRHVRSLAKLAHVVLVTGELVVIYLAHCCTASNALNTHAAE